MLYQIFTSGGSAVEIFIQLVAVIGSALIAIMTHEVAHGYMALWNGDPTAKMAGRLNFNPKSHFDLFGAIMILTIGIGWAKPVPVNFYNLKDRKKGVFLVAIAGVLANLCIAIIAFLLVGILSVALKNLTTSSEFVYNIISLIYTFLVYSIVLNTALIAFNLLPIFPLDGFRVVQAFWPNSNFCNTMGVYGPKILIGLLILGFVADLFSNISPAFAYLDILGQYVGFVQRMVIRLVKAAWGAIFGI